MLKQITLCAFAVLMFSTKAFASSYYRPENPSDSKEIVEIKVGDTYFRFPESFFTYTEDRLPIAHGSTHVRIYVPDFSPPPGVLRPDETDSTARSEWDGLHPSITVYIGANGKLDRDSYNNVLVYPLSEKVELKYYEPRFYTRKLLTPEGVREKLKPYMYKEPSSGWEENQKLAERLLINVRHFRGDTNAASDVGHETPPPLPPIVPMDVIEQGLSHKNQAIRSTAVKQLARHEGSPEVAERLYRIASKDK